MIKLSYITPTGGSSGGDGIRTRYEIPTTSSILEKQVSTTLVSNFGQSGTITWTLPIAKKELDFIAQIGTATGSDYIIIKPPIGESLLLITDHPYFVTQIDCKDANEGDSIWFRVIESVVDGNFIWFGTIIAGDWLTSNDFFWCVGGVQNSAQVNLTREMNIKTNAWSLNTPYPVTIQAGSSAMIGGDMYVGAGNSGGDTTPYPYISAFNFITQTWSSSISVSWQYKNVSFIGIGSLGYYHSAAIGSLTAGMQIFDKTLSSWTTKFPANTTVRVKTYSFGSKNTGQTGHGIFYSCGGPPIGAPPTDLTYFYYPPSDAFINKTTYPVGGRSEGGSFRKNETEGNCWGGINASAWEPTADNYKFTNSGSGAWTGETNIPFIFSNAGGNIGCGAGGKGYLTGGSRAWTGSTACSQYFNTAWTLMTPYPATYINYQSTTSFGENAVA